MLYELPRVSTRQGVITLMMVIGKSKSDMMPKVQMMLMKESEKGMNIALFARKDR